MSHAIDVACFIITREPMPQDRLQRMLFLCQKCSVNMRDRTLFPEQFEAWKDGPVVREVYNLENWGEYTLTEDERDFVLGVMEEFRDVPTEGLLIM